MGFTYPTRLEIDIETAKWKWSVSKRYIIPTISYFFIIYLVIWILTSVGRYSYSTASKLPGGVFSTPPGSQKRTADLRPVWFLADSYRYGRLAPDDFSPLLLIVSVIPCLRQLSTSHCLSDRRPVFNPYTIQHWQKHQTTTSIEHMPTTSSRPRRIRTTSLST